MTHIYELCCHLSFRPFCFEHESVLVLLFLVLAKYSRHTIFTYFYFFQCDWFRLVITKTTVIFLEKTSYFAGEKDALVLEVSGKRENCRVFSTQICDVWPFSPEENMHFFGNEFSQAQRIMLGSNWSCENFSEQITWILFFLNKASTGWQTPHVASRDLFRWKIQPTKTLDSDSLEVIFKGFLSYLRYFSPLEKKQAHHFRNFWYLCVYLFLFLFANQVTRVGNVFSLLNGGLF